MLTSFVTLCCLASISELLSESCCVLTTMQLIISSLDELNVLIFEMLLVIPAMKSCLSL